MDEKFTVRRFVPADAIDVQKIIHRGLREVNGKDYPAERIEEYCAFFTTEKIIEQADTAQCWSTSVTVGSTTCPSCMTIPRLQSSPGWKT